MWVSLRGALSDADFLQRTGVPFAVRTLEDFNVHVSSEVHIKELSEAPEDELSLHALAKDVSARVYPPHATSCPVLTFATQRCFNQSIQ